MIIVLLGPPGAGKGTQAERIRNRYGIPHISTGELFRAAMEEESELGRSVRGYIEAGQLVPDEVTSAVVAARIDRPDCRDGFMLDGYPRNLGQAGALDGLLREGGLRLSAVLYLDVSDETAVERLADRRLCERCGANYHLRYMPPREPDRCDHCGGKLLERADDNPETIRERLKVYAQQTEALVEEYERGGLLRRIDANRSPEEVASSVVTVVDAFSARSLA